MASSRSVWAMATTGPPQNAEGDEPILVVRIPRILNGDGVAVESLLCPNEVDAHATLDRFFQIHAAGVRRFEGMVDQHTGHGIMAFFGVPIAHENDAEQTERILSMRGQRMPVSHSIRTAVKEPSDTVTARAGGSDIAPGQVVTSISY